MRKTKQELKDIISDIETYGLKYAAQKYNMSVRTTGTVKTVFVKMLETYDFPTMAQYIKINNLSDVEQYELVKDFITSEDLYNDFYLAKHIRYVRNPYYTVYQLCEKFNIPVDEIYRNKQSPHKNVYNYEAIYRLYNKVGSGATIQKIIDSYDGMDEKGAKYLLRSVLLTLDKNSKIKPKSSTKYTKEEKKKFIEYYEEYGTEKFLEAFPEFVDKRHTANSINNFRKTLGCPTKKHSVWNTERRLLLYIDFEEYGLDYCIEKYKICASYVYNNISKIKDELGEPKVSKTVAFVNEFDTKGLEYMMEKYNLTKQKVLQRVSTYSGRIKNQITKRNIPCKITKSI